MYENRYLLILYILEKVGNGCSQRILLVTVRPGFLDPITAKPDELNEYKLRGDDQFLNKMYNPHAMTPPKA